MAMTKVCPNSMYHFKNPTKNFFYKTKNSTFISLHDSFLCYVKVADGALRRLLIGVSRVYHVNNVEKFLSYFRIFCIILTTTKKLACSELARADPPALVAVRPAFSSQHLKIRKIINQSS